MAKKQSEETKVAPKWTLIKEYTNDKVDILYKAYKLDKKKARILFCQNKTSYKQTRVVLFEWPNDEFRICHIVKSFGISKTNIIYHREKTTCSIRYTKKKLYYQNQFHTKQMNYCDLSEFLRQFGEVPYKPGTCIDFLTNKFGWLRNVIENTKAHAISFNLIISKKLFNPNTISRYKFGVPLPVVKILEANMGTYQYNDYLKVWAEMKNNLINVENITEAFLKDKYLKDISLMAEALGKKINCAWSPKRIKLEHDKWAKEVVDVILEFEPLRDLTISSVFKDFQKYSGYELLMTNHQLIAEGKRMGHCVGTYSGKVDSGSSAIYRVQDHTLELELVTPYYGTDKLLANELGLGKILKIGQYRGFSNESAPSVLTALVAEKVLAFNKNELGNSLVTIDKVMVDDDLLPF